jgi:hypothetical protein
MSEELSTQTVSPKAASLPPLPEEDPFTPAQWKTLLAIADTVIPTIKPASLADPQTEKAIGDSEYGTAMTTLKERAAEPTDALTTAYFQEKPSTIPQFRDIWYRQFGMFMPQDARKQLAGLLNILE